VLYNYLLENYERSVNMTYTPSRQHRSLSNFVRASSVHSAFHTNTTNAVVLLSSRKVTMPAAHTDWLIVKVCHDMPLRTSGCLPVGPEGTGHSEYSVEVVHS